VVNDSTRRHRHWERYRRLRRRGERWPCAHGNSAIADQTFTINQIAAQPSISANGVVNAASSQPGFASGTWIAICGTNLSTTTRSWSDSDFAGDTLPTQLDGVGVNINQKPAYVRRISPSRLEVLAPEDPAQGPVLVEVVNVLGSSNTVTAQKQSVAPGLYTQTISSGRFVSAVFSDGTVVGRLDQYPNVAGRPSKPGDAITFYATGLGPTDPPYPDGMLIHRMAHVSNQILISIGGVAASVDFAGIIKPGLYQIDTKVPDVPDGDLTLSMQVSGFDPTDEAYLTIQR
jgi:uncharacterized protein (TIGR03437 family)